jgi:hypothetical protein
MKMKILLTLLFSVFLIPLTYAANFVSSYATIAEDHCSTLTNQGQQGSTQTCPSFKAIGIRVIRDEVQQHLILNRGNQEYPLIFNDTTTKNIARTTLGSTLEWRLKRGRVVGLIMRLNVFTTAKKKRSFLVVSKVTDQTICVVGSVSPQRKQNERARNMVDSAANKPCLSAPLSQDKTLKALLGSWVEPVPGRSKEVQGFTLYENGKAESINMKTLRYQKWRVEGNNIIFTIQNIVNSWSSSEDERYTFAFCDGQLCLTAGGITQEYKRQVKQDGKLYYEYNGKLYYDYNGTQTQYSSPHGGQHSDVGRINIGMMIGRQYADHCSFLQPSDLRKFIYKNDNSWRFIFSSNPKKRSARMLLNGHIENLELLNIAEDFYSKTVTERYRVQGHQEIVITIKKTEVNSFRHYKRYKGNVTVERNGVASEMTVLGDCRL